LRAAIGLGELDGRALGLLLVLSLFCIAWLEGARRVLHHGWPSLAES